MTSPGPRPASYRVQPACANCEHVRLDPDYDGDHELYCVVGIVAIGSWGTMTAYDHLFPVIHHVSQKHQLRLRSEPGWDLRLVLPNGVCDQHAPVGADASQPETAPQAQDSSPQAGEPK